MNGDERQAMKDEIRTALKWLVRMTVVLYAVLIVGGAFIFQNQQDTKTALCTFVVDLEARVAQSEAFLEENPEGIPGIPAAFLRSSIRNQRLTIESLSGLGCGP